MIKNRQLIKKVRSYGFSLVRCKRHLVFSHPCGATLVTAQTASDHRHLKNVERDIRQILKKHGINAPSVS